MAKSEIDNINLSSKFAHPIKNSKTSSKYISFSKEYIDKLLINYSLKK